MVDLKEISTMIKEIIAELKLMRPYMDNITDWDTAEERQRNFDLLGDFFEESCQIVEVVKDLFSLSDDEILDMLAKALDAAIPLPWYVEPYDDKLFRFGLGIVWSRIKDKIMPSDEVKAIVALKASAMSGPAETKDN